MNATVHKFEAVSPSASAAPAGKYNRPLKRDGRRKNFIPEQSWLSYNWIDRDPELDLVQSAIAESGMSLEQIERETEKTGHRVSRYTLYAWCYGDTRRPQNATLTTVMAAIGWDKHWVRRG